jgi:hypothetical protein
MSDYTFNNSFVDLYYELNDSEIWNDIYLIQGAAGSEQTIRGYDTATIAKYGRRSKRIDRPLVVDEATGQTLVEASLDRYIEPAARITMSVIGDVDEIIVQLLTRDISDKVTIQCTEMGLDSDFIIENITLFTDISMVIQARYELVALRSGE